MPALKPTDFIARIVWLGLVPADGGLQAEARDNLVLGFDGIPGEKHGGLTRASCSRVISQHPRGTEIRNARQVSIASAEDLALIAADMGLDAIRPEWIGASMVIEGIPDFSHVPPSSRLQGPDGCAIAVDMENRPCHLPGREIDKDAQGFGGKFKRAARSRRGIVGWVERPGTLRIGDELRLHVPDQPVWAHLDQARG
ncbi:MOSC domain-containing protein [Mesobacterium sp. TK19101]|uniref:MOSC domain-containing protein n=1 Tax=Mesobacterium hydrothermale TaxID=3111907 RepID=A0ABU6HE08_9RHOB|nr:MOSC domain-containing protein [Mesobacterium sp. TK19101]MEC3859703.1 MOSC domain-containing protein [Mesobacterium sp. TK19101]